MRDYRKLLAFNLADKLVIKVYEATTDFPKNEVFGLTAQIRRAAVSVPSNIVEGCARSSEKDYVRFLEIAFGSLHELKYQMSLANRLGYLEKKKWDEINSDCEETAKVLTGIIKSISS